MKTQIAISAQYVKPLLKLAPQYDIDYKSLLTQANIQESELNSNRTFLSLDQLEQVITSFIQGASRPELSITYGKALTLSDHGMAGIAAMTQLTMLDMLKLIERVSLWAFPPISLEFIERGEYVGIAFKPNQPINQDCYQFILEVIIASFTTNFKFLFPRKSLYEIGFSYPAPKHKKEMENLFGCPVVFDADSSYMLGHRSDLTENLAFANQETAQLAEKNFYDTTPPPKIRSLAEKVLHLIKTDLGMYKRAEVVAAELAMSPRTLRRKLHAANVSFSTLLDSARKEMAIQMLQEGHYSLTEIAMRLHFSDSSAFAKAFKNWTGMTAREFTRAH